MVSEPVGFPHTLTGDETVATMTYSGKIPVLGQDGYSYWKGRMEAFLVSQSQDIWDATQSTTFVVLVAAQRNTPEIVA